MPIKIFGIKNCDTVKKALQWLEAHEIPAELHDFRTNGLSNDLLDTWIATCGLPALVNKRSTTYRQLDETQRTMLTEDTPDARTLLIEQPTLIKRPVLNVDAHIEIGFKSERYHTLFKMHEK